MGRWLNTKDLLFPIPLLKKPWKQRFPKRVCCSWSCSLCWLYFNFILFPIHLHQKPIPLTSCFSKKKMHLLLIKSPLLRYRFQYRILHLAIPKDFTELTTCWHTGGNRTIARIFPVEWTSPEYFYILLLEKRMWSPNSLFVSLQERLAKIRCFEVVYLRDSDLTNITIRFSEVLIVNTMALVPRRPWRRNTQDVMRRQCQRSISLKG